MWYYPLSAVIISVTSLVFGLFVIYKNSKSLVNILYFFFCLSAFWWSLFYFFWQVSVTAESALFFIRLLMIGAIYSSFFYLACVVYFLGKDVIYKKLLYFFFFLTLIWVYFDIFTNQFVSGVEPRLSFEFWPVPGIFFHPFLLVFFFHVLLASYLLITTIRNTKGVVRPQAKFMLIGLGLAFLGGSSNYFLWYNIPIPPYGNILVISFVVFTGYAILKYRLMDIRVAIKRSAIFTILVLFIASIFSVSAFIFSTFIQSLIGKSSTLYSGIITGIIVAVGFEPIKRLLTNVTDSFLFKGEYKVDELLSKLSGDFSSTLDLKTIISGSGKDLYDAFRIKGLTVYLFDKNSTSYEERFFIGEHLKPISLNQTEINGYNKFLMGVGMHKVILVTEELKRVETPNAILTQLIKKLEDNQVALTVPLYLKDDLIGFYFLNEKKSGDTFTTQDIQVLEIMAGQAATAIENALLYEEQKKFTQKLQDEVNRATLELRSANKELKKLDKAKSEFISIASHQLRTPMTVIKGYVSMMQDGDFGPVAVKMAKPLTNVFQSTNRLLSLIEDLLNVSRIESGRMTYEFERTNLQVIVETVFEDLKNYAKTKKLEFEYHGPSKPLPDIVIDTKKIREVIMNLADNAIKYTPAGRVDVYLELKGPEIVYKVVDSGRGLNKEDIGKLFKKFSRVGGAQLVHTEGTGLGLYIAKQIIMKHNGKIWAESVGEGQGSTFAIALKVSNPKLDEELKKQEIEMQAAKDMAKLKASELAKMKKPEIEYKEDTIDLSRIKKV